MALVSGGQSGGEGDLLAAVGGEDLEAVVVDADAVVGVVGVERDLHGERESGGRGISRSRKGRRKVGGGGEVEVVNGAVLEDEAGFGGPEDGPY